MRSCQERLIPIGTLPFLYNAATAVKIHFNQMVTYMNILEPKLSVYCGKVILQCFIRNLITVSESISLYMYTCLCGFVQTIVYFRNWKISLPSVSMNCPTAFFCVISKHSRVAHSKMRKFITCGSHTISCVLLSPKLFSPKVFINRDMNSVFDLIHILFNKFIYRLIINVFCFHSWICLAISPKLTVY